MYIYTVLYRIYIYIYICILSAGWACCKESTSLLRGTGLGPGGRGPRALGSAGRLWGLGLVGEETRDKHDQVQDCGIFFGLSGEGLCFWSEP